MASWVALSGTTGTLWGDSIGYYAADLGVYTGPWPIRPPGVFPAGGVAEFLIAVPNPADPTDLTIVGDGTYDCVPYYAQRGDDGSGGSFVDYYAYPSGPGSPTVDMVQPVGAHLYVTTDNSSLPTETAESYVPPSYASGGTAGFESAPGAWTSWQTPVGESSTVVEDGSSSHLASSGSDDEAGDKVLTGLIGGTLAAITASGVPVQSASVNSSLWSVFGWKSSAGSPPGGGVGSETKESLGIVENRYHFHAAPGLSLPGPLGSLTFQTDYGPSPYLNTTGHEDGGYEYDGTTLTGQHWDAATSLATNGGNAGNTADPAVTINVDWAPAGTTIPTDAYHAGTNVDTVTIHSSDGSGSTAVDLSGISAAEMWLFIYPAPAVSGSLSGVEAPNITMTALADYDCGFTLALGTMTYHWTTPQWRYWTPGAIVPSAKWRTVGGHFATVGGADLKIKTPGVGWVKVVAGT